MLEKLGINVLSDEESAVLVKKWNAEARAQEAKQKKKPRARRAKLALLPGKGLGPVALGMKRKAVRDALKKLGLPLSAKQETLDYFGEENGIQVEYTDGTASFIGVAPSDEFQVTLYGVDPFDTPARALFKLIAKKDGAKGHEYDDTGYSFGAPVVTLYEADPQYDRAKGKRAIWGQVGTGDARYAEASGL